MRSRRAFTLYELLVILALLGLLAALFFPALYRVRQASQRASSQNNLKQIGIACHNYHDVNGAFPPGNNEKNYSAAAVLLPYIEQDNLYKRIDFNKPPDGNAEIRKVLIKTYVSPLDPVMKVNDYGPTNYLFNAGAKPSLKDNNGVFWQNSKLPITGITDGTSNTVMVGETLKGDGQKKPVTVQRQHIAYKADALKDLDDKSGVRDWKEGKNIAGNRCASWMDGRFLQGTYTATRKINDERPDVDCGGAGGLSGLRTVANVINVAMGDGSVRAVSPEVKFDTWKAMHTRAGGEVINLDF